MEKQIEYAAKLNDQIAEMFNNEDCDNYIDKTEFQDEKNLKDFVHAFANFTCCNLFNKLTGNDKNLLEFNQIANQLVFEFATREKEEKPE